MRVSVLTVSDSVSSGKSEDRSGPAVIARCKELGWTIVASSVLPDDQPAIESYLKKTSDSKESDLILTTGGTGVGLPRCDARGDDGDHRQADPRIFRAHAG